MLEKCKHCGTIFSGETCPSCGVNIDGIPHKECEDEKTPLISKQESRRQVWLLIGEGWPFLLLFPSLIGLALCCLVAYIAGFESAVGCPFLVAALFFAIQSLVCAIGCAAGSNTLDARIDKIDHPERGQENKLPKTPKEQKDYEDRIREYISDASSSDSQKNK